MKNEYKKLTVKDLLAQKDNLKSKKSETKEFYVKSLDATITVNKPDRQLCIDSIEKPEKEGDIFLVYNSIIEPNFKDTELHKEFGCVEPM